LHFAPDTEADLEFLVDLCNTDGGASRSGLDELPTPESLTALLDAAGYSGRFDRDQRELDEVKASRTLLRGIWSMDAEAAVTAINRMLADAHALPQLRRHDGLDWHFHATGPDAPLAERIRVEAAMALSELIRSGELGRLRICAADDCTGVFVDLSRNGSKRFCSVRCGNRVNMIAFRERAAEA
jgi:predicted RNA-binding Zn ribbon-like protein